MNRSALFFVLLLLALAGVTAARGQETPLRDDTQPTVVKLMVYPAAEPKPPLKYQLLPPLLDRTPGNAAIEYPKSRLDVSAESFTHMRELEDKIADEWEDLPADQLPLEEIRKQLSWAKHALHYSEVGARCDRCDWEVPIHTTKDLMMLLLPETNPMRQNARFVAMSARLQVADGHYDEAIHSLQTGYAMARHVSQEPFLVSGLVGMAICSLLTTPVQDLIVRPDSPNLYWALTELPHPFIDLHAAWELERATFLLSYPELRDLDKRHYSPEELRPMVDRFVRDLKLLGSDNNTGGLGKGNVYHTRLAILALKAYPAAKRYLVEQGRTLQEVEEMPVAQVIGLHMMSVFEQLRDEQMRWFTLPYAEAAAFAQRDGKRFAEVSRQREIIPFAQIYVPAVRMIIDANVRTQRQFAMLRVIEALRMYAAEHDGQWPNQLSDITAVPVPLDPITGKPFEYTRTGDTAKIISPPPLGQPPRSGLQYELTMVRK